MKAVVYDAPRQFSIRTVPTLEPGPTEVRVALAATGICGTDLHIDDGDFFASFPLTPGHEPFDVYRRELTIRGSFAQVSSFPQALAALRSGRVRTDGVITHRFGLDRFVDAPEAVRSDESCLKASVEL